LELYCKSIDEISVIATNIINFAGKERIWLFDGEMGAGKTTLIKAVCEQLGVIDNVSSPTFAIVNEYLTQKNERIFHFDFYRLKNEREALEIGIEEYFDSGNYCFLEWASLIPSLLPEKYIVININVLLDKQRVITLSRYE
jgi:tRNA threonylcarbamoyladenosine biosynthesis protein TsaE